MTGDIGGLMLGKEIKELALECNDSKTQALGLPTYLQTSE